MPIYGFTCQACGHQFDRLQKLSDADPDTCPECHARAIRRQVSAPSFRLAGGGWYETDFKGKGEKHRNLAGNQDSTGGASAASGQATTSKGDGSSKGGESKPAAAPAGE